MVVFITNLKTDYYTDISRLFPDYITFRIILYSTSSYICESGVVVYEDVLVNINIPRYFTICSMSGLDSTIDNDSLQMFVTLNPFAT